ncbi:uncharacterized protein J4E84_001385 [Alternaria hordeiaustralica]|uniref:uncharacterized protein n=1 Tax=Alternaria hordeiaustralica TaxID=1187925 RepID=UPI0020C532A7|nr:uncharacterized protein J4E84_001385 [Alternaria hordeiaustralica]KAI4698249.1 hypothetical protein J4E84_001385 [Alternaria hordeiaustralica]
MSDNVRGKDLLNFMDKLAEPERSQFFELLSKEDAVATMQASLHERDRLRGTGAQPSELAFRTQAGSNVGIVGEHEQNRSEVIAAVASEVGDTAIAEDIPPDLHVYLRVPNSRGDPTLRDIYDLPQQVQAELEARFKAMWECEPSRTKTYRRFMEKPGHQVNKDVCLRNLVIRSSSAKGTMWAQGGKHKESACDKCIAKREACAHIDKVNNEYIKVFVPLPRDLRKGKKWDELGYWVLED